MGSGLRMNEAEIARIIGGRNQWSTLKATFEKWQQDPSKPFAIQPEQRIQIRKLMEAVGTRMRTKQRIANEARIRIAYSDNPLEHRAIYSWMQDELANVDNPSNLKMVGDVKYRKEGNQWVPIPSLEERLQNLPKQ
jgi:hypothetical protein